METTKKITDKLIDALRKTESELEAFRVQVSLGKAEVYDLFEEQKKKFDTYISRMKAELKDRLNPEKDFSEKAQKKIDELRVQLALGRAESKEVFEEQKKKISRALHELELLIKKSSSADKDQIKEQLRNEIEKFKIKLEILRLKSTLGKAELRDNLEERKKQFNHKLEELRSKFDNRKEQVSERFDHFSDEISEAYEHLKNAFTKT